MNDAIERISAYLSRRQKARGIDKERIHGFDLGPDCGVELLASDLRTLLAEADALRRERDDLAARLETIEQAEPARQEPTALERELLGALQGAYSLAIGHAATYQHQHQLAAPHPTHAEILSQSRAAIAKAGAPTADVPAPAEPQPRPVCATNGLLGATSGVGRECDYWAGGACTSPDPCQHQQPVKPCRTCGPDACSDSTSCPRGGAA